MRKTMVYLEEDQFLLLQMAVAASKRRMSEIIRDALSNYLKRWKNKIDYFSFVGIAEGPKKGNTSEHAEEILREFLK